MTDYDGTRTWIQENLLRVRIPVNSSSNYILAQMVSDTLGCAILPEHFHEAMIEEGYEATQRHKNCYAYNAKLRMTPEEDEVILLDEYVTMEGRHKPVIMFAQVGEQGPIFVAVSTNVGGRLADLDKFNALPIHLRGIMHGAYAAYDTLADDFEPWAIKPNWFVASVEIRQYIYQSGAVENDLDKSSTSTAL